MATFKWTSLREQKNIDRDYPKLEVINHPLKTNLNNNKHDSGNTLIDKLSKWSSAFEVVDPLLGFKQDDSEEITTLDVSDNSVNYTKAWNKRRTAILNKYTTVEKLTIVSSFLPGGEKALIRQVSNLNEKVKHRLEQLDDFDESSVRKTMGLSQQEFITKTNLLVDEMKKAWGTEQRVKAFKIAIQCSKLLSDVSVMQFYPSKFILITDILDIFGNLVFDRLKHKSYGQKPTKSLEDIDPDEVPESAKETCQNWLFKMASIRELLPRLYMEMCLIKCYLFLDKKEIKPVVKRLTLMIRGIGNPLVATYLRVYLCHVASNLLGKDIEECFSDNFIEFLGEYQQIFHPMMKKKYEAQLLTVDRYLNLFVPAVDWILYGTLNSNKCKLTLLEEYLQQCEHTDNNELLLCTLVSGFDSASVVKMSSKILEMIRNSTDKLVMSHEALSALGEHLCAHSQAHAHVASEALAQSWWKTATNIHSPAHFLQVLEPWIQFACTHLSTQHVNVILRGTIRYMIKCGKSPDEFSGNFQSVIKRMLKSIPDVEELFLMDAFMSLVELVQSPHARTMMAKTVLSEFFSRNNNVYIDDHIVIGSLMRLCCILHDSINAVTVEDECKACAELVSRLVVAVTFHDDVDHQLNFYVECRAAFVKLDAVLVALVHRVNALSVGPERHLRRACAAYCCVTVPSLRSPLDKLQLHLLCGQVALLNGCIGQAETNLKAFISLIPDIPEFIVEDGQKKPTNVKVAGLMGEFLSTLLILPDNMDSNCRAYMVTAFVRTLDRVGWNKTEPLYYGTLLRTLDLLAHMTRDHYLYHVEGVISNDKLYGGEAEFIDAVEEHATNVCDELLTVVKGLGPGGAGVALDLFWRVCRRGDLAVRAMLSLATNLWLLARKLDPHSNVQKAMLKTLEQDDRPGTRMLLQRLQKPHD